MSHPPIDCEGFDFSVDQGIGTLVVDRPHKRNALTRDMWLALPGILERIDASEDVSVLILTGAGEHFSAGSDIHDLNVPLDDFWATNSAAEDALACVDIPTIAAISGSCVGGGTELAAACDVRIAAPSSVFGITAAKLGLAYPPGPTRRFAQIVGPAWARYLLLTAEIIDFDEAWRLGFIHQKADAPLVAARELAQTIAGRSVLSQTAVKRTLRGEQMSPAPGEWLAGAYSAEIARGQEAFFSKSAPDFAIRRTDWPAAGAPGA